MIADISSQFSDPKFWITAVSLAVACLAAYNSWQSRRIANRALSINEAQERRRQPQFDIYFHDGYRRYFPTHQLFGFLISVKNPSDINNSIAKAELQVTFVTTGEIRSTCRIPHKSDLAKHIDDPVLVLPSRIDAHQTVRGWLLFTLPASVICNRTIDRHKIILEDSHGVSIEMEPINLREWSNENPKA
jgi:hypothetical protein